MLFDNFDLNRFSEEFFKSSTMTELTPDSIYIFVYNPAHISAKAMKIIGKTLTDRGITVIAVASADPYNSLAITKL